MENHLKYFYNKELNLTYIDREDDVRNVFYKYNIPQETLDYLIAESYNVNAGYHNLQHNYSVALRMLDIMKEYKKYVGLENIPTYRPRSTYLDEYKDVATLQPKDLKRFERNVFIAGLFHDANHSQTPHEDVNIKESQRIVDGLDGNIVNSDDKMFIKKLIEYSAFPHVKNNHLGILGFGIKLLRDADLSQNWDDDRDSFLLGLEIERGTKPDRTFPPIEYLSLAISVDKHINYLKKQEYKFSRPVQDVSY